MTSLKQYTRSLPVITIYDTILRIFIGNNPKNIPFVITVATISRKGCGILYSMIGTMEEVLYMVMEKHHEDTDSFLCKVMSTVLKVISTMETWEKQYHNVMASHSELPWPEVLRNIFMPQRL